jgi:acetoacetate decarboxylase
VAIAQTPPIGRKNTLLSMFPWVDWVYRDAHYLAVEVDVDEGAARSWTPWPLRPAKPAMATIFCAWFPSTTFGSIYRESGIFLHVEHRGRAAIHCPWMIVDDDVALVLGRELLGYPKKMGEIDFRIDGDRIEATARRRGATLVTMRGTLREAIAEPPPMLGRPHRNLRCGMSLSIPRLVAFTPREQPIEVRRAELEVTIAGSERDPIDELGFGRVRAARLHRVNLGAGLDVPHTASLASPLFFVRSLMRRVR